MKAVRHNPVTVGVMPLNPMPDLRELLSVDIQWLARIDQSEFALDDWRNGPGPPIPHVYDWNDQLMELGSRTAIEVASSATTASLPQWREWAAADPENGTRPIGGPANPEEQITAVRAWLRDGDDETAEYACSLADLTIQTYWHHVEYEDLWFEENPGVWTAESAQFCIEALNEVRRGSDASHSILIAILSAANAFRTDTHDSWSAALNSVLTAVRKELMA